MSITTNNIYNAPNFVFDSYKSYQEFLDEHGSDVLNDTIYTINELPIQVYDFGNVAGNQAIDNPPLDGSSFDIGLTLPIARANVDGNDIYMFPVSNNKFCSISDKQNVAYTIYSVITDSSGGYKWYINAISDNTISISDIDKLTQYYFNMHYTIFDDIEDQEIEDDWDTIIENINTGAYQYKYKLGNYKSLDLGSEGIVNMQIAAYNIDTLADGSDKAPITWIAKQALKNTHRMNTYATGTIGGWYESEMRTYLNDTIKPLIPYNVLNAIKTIKNTQKAFTKPDNYQTTQTSSDDIWIPSISMKSKGYINISGLDQNGNSVAIWTREACSKKEFYHIKDGRSYTTLSCDDDGYIILCFCM